MPKMTWIVILLWILGIALAGAIIYAMIEAASL